MVNRRSRALFPLTRGAHRRVEKTPAMSDLGECVVGDTSVWLADGRHIPSKNSSGRRERYLPWPPTVRS